MFLSTYRREGGGIQFFVLVQKLREHQAGSLNLVSGWMVGPESGF